MAECSQWVMLSKAVIRLETRVKGTSMTNSKLPVSKPRLQESRVVWRSDSHRLPGGKPVWTLQHIDFELFERVARCPARFAVLGIAKPTLYPTFPDNPHTTNLLSLRAVDSDVPDKWDHLGARDVGA